jgi:hypothetical protein
VDGRPWSFGDAARIFGTFFCVYNHTLVCAIEEVEWMDGAGRLSVVALPAASLKWDVAGAGGCLVGHKVR